MQITPTRLPEVLIVEPVVHGDQRGFFIESYNARRYRDAGIDVEFVQDNHSLSRRGTLRGLHAQLDPPQAKLIRVTRGEVFDVAVDVRPRSPSFASWTAVRLTAENFKQLYVPAGFAHGFCVLSEEAEVQYKCTQYYQPERELAIAWNDPRIAVDWPVESPLLSAKDSEAQTLAAQLERLGAAGD